MQSYPQQPVYPAHTSATASRRGPGFLIRAIYFVLIGWWLGFIWLHVGYLLCATLILLPVGLLMLDRLPMVLTLRSREQQTHVTMGPGGVAVKIGDTPQRNFLVRLVYFIFIGWWFGLIWAEIGYVLTISVIFLPIGLMMLNRLPAVQTLHRY